MSNRIERPIFFEGQILGAADLSVSVDYHRGQAARHNRYMHLWGIVDGLEAEAKENTTSTGVKFQDITIGPGSAIDGTGREIVVPEGEKLDESLFARSNVAIADATAYYPVFIVGQDEPAPQHPLSVGACNVAEPTRKIEGFEIIFGRPSDVLDVEDEVTDISSGPGDDRWRVLLGFVKWDATTKKFTEWTNDSNGITRRYAGVRADVVEARGGKLSLRAGRDAGMPAVVIDAANPKQTLQFGMLTDEGLVKPVFSVSSSGDVVAEGSISGAVTPGSVQIQSGVATDGIILPLPPGITEEQVSNDQVALHMYVSPRFPGSSPPTTTADWIATPLECSVDADTRRVLCRFRWFDLAAASIVDLPGACNYSVMVSVPAKNGG